MRSFYRGMRCALGPPGLADLPGNAPADARGLAAEPLHAELLSNARAEVGNALVEVHGLPAEPFHAELSGNALAEVHGLPVAPLHAELPGDGSAEVHGPSVERCRNPWATS